MNDDQLAAAYAEGRKDERECWLPVLDALKEAMDAVKTFHGPECWEIYEQHSPEMNRWRAALEKVS